MELLVVVGAVGIGLAALYVAASRAITIAELAVEDGALRVVRGGIAPPILSDLRDVVRRPPVHRATIRIVRASGLAEVRITGDVSPEQAQRIRNVVGSVPLARLVNRG